MDNKTELRDDIKDGKTIEPTLEELEATGKLIDEQRTYQDWLKENKEKLSGPEYILYKLPLSHAQRKQVFENLKKEKQK